MSHYTQKQQEKKLKNINNFKKLPFSDFRFNIN